MGGIVSAAEANNYGQYRDSFEVVISASNAYNKFPFCTGQTCFTYGYCSPNPNCICVQTTEGFGVCASANACNEPCTSSEDCKNGGVCALNTCCGNSGTCTKSVSAYVVAMLMRCRSWCRVCLVLRRLTRGINQVDYPQESRDIKIGYASFTIIEWNLYRFWSRLCSDDCCQIVL